MKMTRLMSDLFDVGLDNDKHVETVCLLSKLDVE